MEKKGRIEIIELLRGMASLAVAWFHFTNGGYLLEDGLVKTSGAFGWLGVEVFFVISGFIIPYSMWRGGYILKRHWKTFIFKRVVRLDPPYIVSILLIIVVSYASAMMPGFQGSQPDFSAGRLLLHLGYLNAFFDYAWLNPVFWTLAIEFQYYLTVSLIYPAISHSSSGLRTAALVSLCVLPIFVTSETFLFHWLSLFTLGIATFQLFVGLIERRAYFIILSGAALATWLTLGPLVMAVGLVAALIIAFIKIPRIPIFTFLGAISYSLYLLHVPIGGRVVNIGTRLDTVWAYPTLAVALGVSIFAAALLSHFVEKPAQRWSSRIKYISVRPAAEDAAVSGEARFAGGPG